MDVISRGSRRGPVFKLGVALVGGALSLVSGGLTAHALSVSTTALTGTVNPTAWGQSVTFTATITPVSPAPTGTVTFQDGGVNIASCVNRTVAARVATCTLTTLAVASHTITAVYSGNATYATSTSAPLVQVVNAGGTSTVLVSSANPSVSGQTVTYTATVTATAPAAGTRSGTVNFGDGGLTIAGCGVRAVSAAGAATCAIAYAGPGSHAITAIYSGDANFTTSTSSNLTQTVNDGATTTALAASVNPSSTGQAVTLTATVAATAPATGTRTGTVDFQDGGVDIPTCNAQAVPASGKATCVISTLIVGAHPITAIYSGDGNFTGSTSSILSQNVGQGNTTTKVVSSLNPSNTGVTVTFTATVSPVAPAKGTGTGTVDFQVGGVDIAGCAAQALSGAATATCATSTLPAGVDPITAVYSGDTNFTTSTSPALTQTVINTTATGVVSSANPSVFGQTIIYSATVSGGPVATGTITFRDGGSNIAGCVAVPMVAGVATCAATPALGSRSITAVYGGDATHAASTSPALTQVVTAASTTTVITSTVNPSVFGQSVTFTATVTVTAPGGGTATGNVAFQNGGANIAGCSSVALVAGVATCTTSALTAGGRAITGLFKGSADFLTSTSPEFTETVNKGVTAAIVLSSLDPSVSGQSVTYTATVSVVAPALGTPTGSVAFQDGGVTIAGCGAKALPAGGTATCTVSYAGAGTHTISVIYAGDANFTAATSSTLTQTVSPASTSTAVASSLNPSVTGQSVTIMATLSVVAPGSGAPTGTVDFQAAGADITGCTAQPLVANQATCAVSTLATGPNAISATYSGDADFSTSTSPILTQTIDQGATTTLATSSANPSVSGQSVTYNATVSAVAPSAGTPTGTIAFTDGGSPISGCGAQPVVGGVASCSATYAGVGMHAITATYTGDTDFTGSTSVTLTQKINQGATATMVTSSTNPSVSGETVAFTATITAVAPATGTLTGTATFMDGGAPLPGCGLIAAIADTATCTVTYAGAGSHPITVVYSGDVDFLSSTSAPFTHTVNQGATTTLVAPSVNPALPGLEVTYTAAVVATSPAAGTPTGTVTFMDGASSITGCIALPLASGVATCDPTYASAGSHVITATYSGDANFTGSASPMVTESVVHGTTSISLTSASTMWPADVAGTITATVSPVAPATGVATGTVTFLDGGAPIAGCSTQPLVNGVASCSVAYAVDGTSTITAIYNGDGAFTASTSPAFTVTVYNDPQIPTPDAGANAGASGLWASLAAGLGIMFIALGACVRRRRCSTGALIRGDR